jgi:hypothetical protein
LFARRPDRARITLRARLHMPERGPKIPVSFLPPQMMNSIRAMAEAVALEMPDVRD